MQFERMNDQQNDDDSNVMLPDDDDAAAVAAAISNDRLDDEGICVFLSAVDVEVECMFATHRFFSKLSFMSC